MLSPCSHKFVSHNHPSESFSLYLALFCFPSSFHLVPYLLSLSLSFPILFILSPIILSLPVRFLTILSVVRGYFFTLLLLGCAAGLIYYLLCSYLQIWVLLKGSFATLWTGHSPVPNICSQSWIKRHLGPRFWMPFCFRMRRWGFLVIYFTSATETHQLTYGQLIKHD